MSRKWICFFSQTGSEINEIRKSLGVNPDLIVTNRKNLEGVNKELQKLAPLFYFLPNRPTENDYRKLVDTHVDTFNECIVTLHGYLRIMPRFMCEKFDIINSHPGDVTIQNGILKGFNPQEKAFKLGLCYSGSTIHQCTPDLDGGEILDLRRVSIQDQTLEQIYKTLHDNSTQQWIDFLRTRLQK